MVKAGCTQIKTWTSALLFFVVFTLICGVGYTFVCTGLAQLIFPYQANGSQIQVSESQTQSIGSLKDTSTTAYGSVLVGQPFSAPNHMWGRVMDPQVVDWGSGSDDELWYRPSNLNPASQEFATAVQKRIEFIHSADPQQADQPIPSDLVTNSGSGFDPDISLAAAYYQVDRLSKNTGKSPDEIRAIIKQCTTEPTVGVLGSARVNVLKVNLMLDGIAVVHP